MIAQSSTICIDLTKDTDIQINELPRQKTQAKTEEELKKCPIFNNQFLNEVLKEAKNDEEKQFIANTFQEVNGDHDNFTLKLCDIDWFLERYENMFNQTMSFVKPDFIPKIRPTTEQNPSTSITRPENPVNKAYNTMRDPSLSVKYEPPSLINYNPIYPSQLANSMNTFPMCSGPQVPWHTNYSGFPPLNPPSHTPQLPSYTLPPYGKYPKVPSYPAANPYGTQKREEYKGGYVQQRPNTSNLPSNIYQKSEPYKKRKIETKIKGKEVLLRVKDYLENVLGEVNKMCEMDDDYINPEDVIKLINDRISMFN